MPYVKMSTSNQDINDTAKKRQAGVSPDKEMKRLSSKPMPEQKKKESKIKNFFKKMFKKKK